MRLRLVDAHSPFLIGPSVIIECSAAIDAHVMLGDVRGNDNTVDDFAHLHRPCIEKPFDAGLRFPTRGALQHSSLALELTLIFHWVDQW